MSSRTRPKRVLFASPWWHQDIVNGFIQHASGHGWHVDLQTVLTGKLPKNWNGDGVFTLLGRNPSQQQAFLSSLACPAISINTNHPQIPIPRVSQDDALVGQLAAEHFLALGFQSYAFYCHGLSMDTSRVRLHAFRKALPQERTTLRDMRWKRQSMERDDDDWEARQAWLLAELKDLRRPLAVFATNDQAAVDIIECCLSANIQIPDEVAVLGVLDMPIFRHCTTVPLSSIQVDFDTITKAACNLLADMMNGAPAPEEPILFPPSGVAVRRSTETIAAQTPAVAKAIRFMMQQFAAPLDSDQIARATGMSKSSLYAAFKDDLGKTPYAILTTLRLQHAKKLLRESNQPVYTIAEACGFGEPVNLYRNFEQLVGMSPTTFRKQVCSTKP